MPFLDLGEALARRATSGNGVCYEGGPALSHRLKEGEGSVEERTYRGHTLHRGQSQEAEAPLTGELSRAARDIIRFLEATKHEALLTEISASLAEFRRAEIQHAVDQLEAAGMVKTDSTSGQPVIRLLPPFTGAGKD